MKRSKFSPTQIANILKEFDQGKDVATISRDHGVSKATFYKWRQRYGGMCLFHLKSIPGFQFKSIPLLFRKQYLKKKGVPLSSSGLLAL
jgi:putative transposase